MSLGWSPICDDIELTRGDWILARTSRNGLPPGTTAEIRWGNGVTWPATVDGSTVNWRIEQADCTAAIVPHGTAFEMRLSYPNPEAADGFDNYVWQHGYAYRNELPEGDF